MGSKIWRRAMLNAPHRPVAVAVYIVRERRLLPYSIDVIYISTIYDILETVL